MDRLFFMLEKFLKKLILFSILFTLAVIILGAYTRLTDSGLGCPDWPGCYGRFFVHHIEDTSAYDSPLREDKAWIEMVHRYLAGTLGVLILTIALLSVFLRFKKKETPVFMPVLLLAVVIGQAALGMLTVTLKLHPLVVMLHLLGGFSTLLLLWILHIKWNYKKTYQNELLRLFRAQPMALASFFRLRKWSVIALLALIIQIALGGWMAANYAALACPDFPMCQSQWWPKMDFEEAFLLWQGFGQNYEYGVLENPARVAIHMMHRLFAIVAFLIVLIFSLKVFSFASQYSSSIKKVALMTILLLLLQVSLGISNIVAALPLGVALAHNAVAAILLCSLVTLLIYVFSIKKDIIIFSKPNELDKA